MANLLPGRSDPDPFPPITPQDRERIARRAAPLAGGGFEDRVFAALALDLAAELDELEATPSLTAAQAILARVEAERGAAAMAPSIAGGAEGGRWLWYRPGRSLETGEAEIASRGFYDVKDRPPLGFWVDAFARPRARGAEGFEVAVLFWAPADAEARAEAGRAACTSGALADWSELAAGDPPEAPSA